MRDHDRACLPPRLRIVHREGMLEVIRLGTFFMKWERYRQSSNVEDRRGQGLGGGGHRHRHSYRGANRRVTVWCRPAHDAAALLSGGGAIQEQGPAPAPPPPDDRHAAFVSTVLADTEDVWAGLMQHEGTVYRAPKLVLFRGATLIQLRSRQRRDGTILLPGR